MFDKLDSFAQAFERENGSGGRSVSAEPLKIRKTLSQRLTFIAANALVLPVVAITYQIVSADGLRSMLGVFSTRLYKLPIPGASMMRQYAGWQKLDAASLSALLLFGGVTYIWYRIFSELLGEGRLLQRCRDSLVLFYMVAGIAGIILCGDCVVFYSGLQAKAAGGWVETPAYVAPLATLLFVSGQAAIGWFHADWRHSGAV